MDSFQRPLNSVVPGSSPARGYFLAPPPPGSIGHTGGDGSNNLSVPHSTRTLPMPPPPGSAGPRGLQHSNPLFSSQAAAAAAATGASTPQGGGRLDVENAGSAGPARNLVTEASVSPEMQPQLRGMHLPPASTINSMLPTPPPQQVGFAPPAPPPESGQLPPPLGKLPPPPSKLPPAPVKLPLPPAAQLPPPPGMQARPAAQLPPPPGKMPPPPVAQLPPPPGKLPPPPAAQLPPPPGKLPPPPVAQLPPPPGKLPSPPVAQLPPPPAAQLPPSPGKLPPAPVAQLPPPLGKLPPPPFAQLPPPPGKLPPLPAAQLPPPPGKLPPPPAAQLPPPPPLDLLPGEAPAQQPEQPSMSAADHTPLSEQPEGAALDPVAYEQEQAREEMQQHGQSQYEEQRQVDSQPGAAVEQQEWAHNGEEYAAEHHTAADGCEQGYEQQTDGYEQGYEQGYGQQAGNEQEHQWSAGEHGSQWAAHPNGDQLPEDSQQWATYPGEGQAQGGAEGGEMQAGYYAGYDAAEEQQHYGSEQQYSSEQQYVVQQQYEGQQVDGSEQQYAVQQQYEGQQVDGCEQQYNSEQQYAVQQYEGQQVDGSKQQFNSEQQYAVQQYEGQQQEGAEQHYAAAEQYDGQFGQEQYEGQEFGGEQYNADSGTGAAEYDVAEMAGLAGEGAADGADAGDLPHSSAPGLPILKLPPPPSSTASPTKAAHATASAQLQHAGSESAAAAEIKAHSGGMPPPPPAPQYAGSEHGSAAGQAGAGPLSRPPSATDVPMQRWGAQASAPVIPRPTWPTAPEGSMGVLAPMYSEALPPRSAAVDYSRPPPMHGPGTAASTGHLPPLYGSLPTTRAGSGDLGCEAATPYMNRPGSSAAHSSNGDAFLPGTPHSFGSSGGDAFRPSSARSSGYGVGMHTSVAAFVPGPPTAAVPGFEPQQQPGTARSNASTPPNPFLPGAGMGPSSGGSQASYGGLPPRNPALGMQSSSTLGAGLGRVPAGSVGSFMPMRPGATAGSTFAPPRPPPSPRMGDADGLAEQGGPALFKPASADAVAATAAAAAGSVQHTGGAQGGKKRRGVCGRRVLPLLLVGLVLSACVGPAPLVVSVTAAANLVHAGLSTASHFSWARADVDGGDSKARAAGTSLRTAVLDTRGGGGRLPLLLSWEPAWQRFDAYLTEASSQQWEAVQQAARCDEHSVWCKGKSWGLHSARLAATLFRDSAVGWVGLLRTSSTWAPQLWAATVTPSISLAKQQAALLQHRLLLLRSSQGRNELGELVRLRGAETRQLAVRLAAWANCVRQHVSTSGVSSLDSITQPAAGCWWQHMGQYLRRLSLPGEEGEEEVYLPAEETLGGEEEEEAEQEWAATGASEEGEPPATEEEAGEGLDSEQEEEAGVEEETAVGEEAEAGTEDGEVATTAEVTAEEGQATGDEEGGELPPLEDQAEEEGSEQQLSEAQQESEEQATEAEEEQLALKAGDEPTAAGSDAELDAEAADEPAGVPAGAATAPPLHLRALGERLTADELAVLQQELSPAQLAVLEAEYAQDGSQQQQKQQEEAKEEQKADAGSEAACPGAGCKQWKEANPAFEGAGKAAFIW